MKTTGLTLGKFAPFHRGHEYLIQTALSQVDHLICLIYDCPEITSVPLTMRANWIRSLYPQVEVIEVWDGPMEVGDSPEIKKMHEEYVLKLLSGRLITHFFCSEFYGEHMSQALGAKNCQVDDAREKVPVSGTAIRENAWQNRQYLSPRVYRDLVTNVVFLGAPSTGKTTIARALAEEYGTLWMPEYGREYWDKHHKDRRLSLEQLVEIAEGHLEREERLMLEANRYLFTDTNALTTRLFSKYYHGTAHPKLEELANKCRDRYDLVFLCDTDIPYDDTWDRSGDANRKVFQRQIVDDLMGRKIPFVGLQGSVAQRVERAMVVLGKFDKFRLIGSLV